MSEPAKQQQNQANVTAQVAAIAAKLREEQRKREEKKK